MMRYLCYLMADSPIERLNLSACLEVDDTVAEEVKSIFQMIFDDPEQFPIYGGWSAGGARFTDTLRHSWGCAIDVNAYYNCECTINWNTYYNNVTCGYGWWPIGHSDTTYVGSMSGQSAYSIGAIANVALSYNGIYYAGADPHTPVGSGYTSWDVKDVIGLATVYEDGSALFSVPSETPVFFQLLDEDYNLVQSMRSWSTLQRGEVFSCVGCHEQSGTTPTATGRVTMAMKAGVPLPGNEWDRLSYEPRLPGFGGSDSCDWTKFLETLMAKGFKNPFVIENEGCNSSHTGNMGATRQGFRATILNTAPVVWPLGPNGYAFDKSALKPMTIPSINPKVVTIKDLT